MTSRELYEKAAAHFLQILKDNKDTLVPIDWVGQISPWDVFCKSNQQATQLCWQADKELRYELSEYQCSWAVVQFCIWLENPNESIR